MLVEIPQSRRLDNGPASSAVRARRRPAPFDFLEYAVDRRHLPANPLIHSTTHPQTAVKAR